MKLFIESDYDRLSRRAADIVAQRINAARAAGRPFVLGLPTGSSPVGMYMYLTKAVAAGQLSFSDVTTFNMDEYVNLPVDHPESYHSYMRRYLFSHVDCPEAQIHILDGNAPDITSECAAYEEAIRLCGGIDLFVGGIGADGHVAFNEPYSSLQSRTRVKTLTLDTRVANARFFGGDPMKVPAQALTVGVATVMDAREVLILCNGYSKARALQAAVEGPVTQQWPVSALQNHPRATILCDEDATAELRVATYKYFKEIALRASRSAS